MILTYTDYILTPDDRYLFGRGEWFRSYQKMGAHRAHDNGVVGYHFNVWAPDVASVSVVGDFNGWEVGANPLHEMIDTGIWQGFVPNIGVGELYKYAITTLAGDTFFKADPYGFASEQIPGTSSMTADTDSYEWLDEDWIARRSRTNHLSRPLNIFEVHLGSWKRHVDGLDMGVGSYLTYDEMASELVAYAKSMGYTHLEFMPVMEHPFDGSWGYQVVGYYAPTSRFGSPDGLKRLIDACHRAGLGVILDWVPSGFCKDEQGLSNFNGSPLFESTEHPTWGTLQFNFEVTQVRAFLISNLLYWIDEFHADGIRVDGVSSLLYLNFGVENEEDKRFAEDGSENDYTSVHFLQRANQVIEEYCPGVMTIAEESSAWPHVTGPVIEGGLGFDYKWDMGWMNDTLWFTCCDFENRPSEHNKLTFSLMYAYNEHYILPLSHDEVVHGKRSLLGRQPGDEWRQFAGLRALNLWQMTHPGSKLNFMGNEIGQYIEWRYFEGIEYRLVNDFETHAKRKAYVEALNKFYLEYPALWQRAYESGGFEWIDCDNAEQNVICFIRHGFLPSDDLACVINFQPEAYEDYRIGVPKAGFWREVFNSDEVEFGGSGVTNGGMRFKASKPALHGFDYSINFRLPPLGGIVFAYDGMRRI